MKVHAPSRTALVLWLLLAILPLRGWAGALMHLPASDPVRVVAGMPCHGEAVDSSGEQAADAPCALCDLCHGSVAVVTAPVLAIGDLPAQGVPATTAPAAPQVDPGALYRPPRR